MMRKFKHKTLGWEAIQEEQVKYKGQYAIFNGGEFALKEKNDNPSKQPDRVYMMYPELIENSQDREEVIEKDYDYVGLIFNEVLGRELDEEYGTRLKWRQAIEKHAPKQKQFTIEDINFFIKSFDSTVSFTITEWITLFLENKGLLSKDTEGETSE